MSYAKAAPYEERGLCVRFTRWWTEAIWRGLMSSIAIWLISSAAVVLGLLLITWGPVAFLQHVGLTVLVIVLACTAPLWITGALLMLVAVSYPDLRKQRSRTANEVATQSERDAGFRRGWVDRWNAFLQWGVSRLVILPTLADGGTGIPMSSVDSLSDDTYLSRYVWNWIVQAVTMLAALAFIAGGGWVRYSLTHNPTESAQDPMYPYLLTLLTYAIALSLCCIATLRYVVTRVVLRHLEGVKDTAARLEGD